MRAIEVRRLGLVPYADALALQRALVEERRADRIGDVLLLVEHPHVLTLGVRGDGGRSHVLATRRVCGRGGVTAGAPGPPVVDTTEAAHTLQPIRAALLHRAPRGSHGRRVQG